ncbi:MAG: protein translocase subunit SecF [Selenomonadaceae bacterium]|nr:protein translocase subunit SecF [Selenomonadaceae bacterium]
MNKFDIAGHRKIWFLLSLCVIIPGFVLMIARGLNGQQPLNFGIDFTGGTIIDLKFDAPVGLADVRSSLDKYGLGGSTIQLSGAASGVTESENVMIRARDMEEDERKEVMGTLKEDLGNYQVLREEKVGATIGGDLITNALLALVISWALIILYVAYRFEWKFGVAAVLALIHDICVVISVFAMTGRAVDSSFVAALLTIVGYSINDTIVIFDRIRENMRLHFRRGGDLNRLVNVSVYQTLTRSLYTVFTVLFTTFALFFFGGDTTKDFAFALLVGFGSGAYSSIFIASPLWIIFRNLGDKHHAAKVAAMKAEKAQN